MASTPPTIFSIRRKISRKARAERIIEQCETASFLLDHMVEDVHERLAFLNYQPTQVLLDGFGSAGIAEGPWNHAASFRSLGSPDFDTPADCEAASFNLVASLNSLDKVNDLPGALIQMRELLAPGGLAIASFIGGSSLMKLRQIMLAADGDRPAARMHPLVDPRSCPQLLGRAGWRNPVVDSCALKVRYSSLGRLVQDLREQAMGNVLASHAPPLTRAGLERAQAAFTDLADEDGKLTETFEIVTLTGWR